MLLSGRSSEIGSIRERVGIRSQVSTQSPVARHNHIGIIGLRSFSSNHSVNPSLLRPPQILLDTGFSVV